MQQNLTHKKNMLYYIGRFIKRGLKLINLFICEGLIFLMADGFFLFWNFNPYPFHTYPPSP